MSSCSDDTSVDDLADKLVIEGYIDDGEFPYVILTTSLHPTAKPQQIASHIVRWGKVSITDGVDTVVMTGGVDGSVFPPFAYRSYMMRGRVEHTYTVIAEYEGRKAIATAIIPPKPRILGHTLREVEDNDSLISVSVTFAPDTSLIPRGSYYMAFVKKSERTSFEPCFLGTKRAEPGEAEVTMSIFQTKSEMLNPDSNLTNFLRGDVIDVMIACIDEYTYHFWEEFQSQIGFGHTAFLSTISRLQGNVEGGYGCFTARGSTRTRIKIE